VVTQGDGPVGDLDGVQVVRVPATDFPYRLPELLTWVGELDHAMGLAARGLRTDVVHVHDWMVGRAGSATAQALEVPLVATIHASEAGRHSGWLPDVVSSSVHLVEQWLVDEADAVIVCSQSMAEEIRRGHGRADAVVIPNGIDAGQYQRSDVSPASLRSGTPHLAFVGRIEWEKGVFTAVNAMPAVLAAYPDARLRVVGTGSQSVAVQDLVDELGLNGSVELLGHVDEPTLRAVYSTADLLLAPSSYEPFGIVALEGAAMGVPLIVGDTGGLAEFVTDERGRRCRPGDALDLAAEVVAALDDPAGTRRRVAAATSALADYTWERIAAQTVEVYARTVRNPSPARRLAVGKRQIW
jgi:glycogen synthase